ncbi:MAG TPA: hypothetical protein VMJ10_08995 [Kofleriaceae bacterium]|nr:hypothetical protein [Kofleriaceae bacterium]
MLQKPAMPMAGSWYQVQILVERWFVLDAMRIVEALRGWRADVALVSSTPDQIALEIPTDDLPLRATIFHAAPDAYAEPLQWALAWSPTWNERWDDTARRCPASIVVAMAARRPINYASFLLAYLALLDATLQACDERDRASCVLHWMPAQQLMSFDHYRAQRTNLGPSGPAVNIRIANVTGRPGELLADTVGLAELGLPDLQIVFRDRDPAEIILRLRLLVRGMFIGERLDCAWTEEASLVPPARDALTLQLE